MSIQKKLALTDIPAIASRSRLQWEVAQQAHVLLYPEGMVKLSDTAAAILNQINGMATVSDIIAALRLLYPGVDLHFDVVEFLNTAYDREWITAKDR